MITIGKAQTPWVRASCDEYAKRLPKDYQLKFQEIPSIKRTKSMSTSQITTMESQKLLEATPKNSLMIALDEHGKEWTSHDLAQKLAIWHHEHQEVSLLIGGPDGWAPVLLKNIPIIWSLSQLTLPHQLVRVIVAEQIYRAWSIITNHPYHRN